MRGYVLRRLGQAIVTILLMTLAVHLAVTLLPGDPIRALFGIRRPDPEVYEALRKQFNFDEPWLVQYWMYLRDLVTGNWGHTYPGVVRSFARVGPPVVDVVRAALPESLRIVIPVLVIQVGAGVLTGMTTITRPGRSGTVIYSVCVLLIGVPVIALAYLLQAVLGWQLRWLPIQGVQSGWISYVMPVASLALIATAFVALLTRSQLRDVLRESFIRAARARSIPEKRIVSLHAMRLSIVPVMSFVVGSLGQLFTGLIVVEGIFSIGGVGGLIYNSIRTRDRVILVTLLVIVTMFVVLASLIADLLHAAADPRVRRLDRSR